MSKLNKSKESKKPVDKLSFIYSKLAKDPVFFIIQFSG